MTLRSRMRAKRFRRMPVTEVIVVAEEGVTILDVSVTDGTGAVTPIGITHVVTGVAYHDADELEPLVTVEAVNG